LELGNNLGKLISGIKNKELELKKFLLFLISIVVLTGCLQRDSQIVSNNISKESDQFRVKRRIVFYNSITDKYMFEMIGNCSIRKDNSDNQLEVTVKLGENKYKKHYLGLSDNVAYMVEQLEYSDVSKYQYEIVFKPKSIIPIKIIVE